MHILGKATVKPRVVGGKKQKLCAVKGALPRECRINGIKADQSAEKPVLGVEKAGAVAGDNIKAQGADLGQGGEQSIKKLGVRNVLAKRNGTALVIDLFADASVCIDKEERIIKAVF